MSALAVTEPLWGHAKLVNTIFRVCSAWMVWAKEHIFCYARLSNQATSWFQVADGCAETWKTRVSDKGFLGASQFQNDFHISALYQTKLSMTLRKLQVHELVALPCSRQCLGDVCCMLCPRLAACALQHFNYHRVNNWLPFEDELKTPCELVWQRECRHNPFRAMLAIVPWCLSTLGYPIHWKLPFFLMRKWSNTEL